MGGDLHTSRAMTNFKQKLKESNRVLLCIFNCELLPGMKHSTGKKMPARKFAWRLTQQIIGGDLLIREKNQAGQAVKVKTVPVCWAKRGNPWSSTELG